jgi:DNA transposition AAA+ family ATPase
MSTWIPKHKTVHTRYFVLAQTVAREAAEQSLIAGFFGPAGTGKTHSLRYFCETSGFESVFVTAAPSPQRKEIFEEILLAITGQVPTESTRGLRRHCEELLAERQRVLVVDECQNLSWLWHAQLRNLHDHPEAKFALLLSGGFGAEKTLQRDQQLWSRVRMRVKFDKLTGQELLNTLHELDPLLAATDDDLLQQIDQRDCRGNLRDWTTILELSRRLVAGSAKKDRLTPQVVRAVFALRGV